MSEKRKYVLGFLFNQAGTGVVLIRKNRPEWQAGKLNGVGGKIEDGESLEGAMAREFKEETGAELKHSRWNDVFKMDGPDWEVYVLMAKEEAAFLAARTTTDEEIVIASVKNLPNDCLSNLHWLIPLVWDYYESDAFVINDIEYLK